MAIDFENPTSLYCQIIADISRKIASGHWQHGEKIASQRALAHSYGVSLITVKKAISELVNAGLLYSRVGMGLYVSEPATMVTLTGAGNIDAALPLFHRVFRAEEHWRTLTPRLPAAGLLPDDPGIMRRILEMGPAGQ